MRLPVAGSMITAVAQLAMLDGAILLTSWPRAFRSSKTASGDLDSTLSLLKPRWVRPERSVEVQRLHARPLERLVQVRVPVRPELDDVEERLQDRLFLVVAARACRAP